MVIRCHFEIRDSRTQRTLNTISSGVIRTRDDIPPRLVKLYYSLEPCA